MVKVVDVMCILPPKQKTKKIIRPSAGEGVGKGVGRTQAQGFRTAGSCHHLKVQLKNPAETLE